jgi:hypothetical protein
VVAQEAGDVVVSPAGSSYIVRVPPGINIHCEGGKNHGHLERYQENI